ncbi:MAG: serine/threonine-protein phosphatase [Anaerolineae bacterium]|jgi:PPM family protein phosphatase|nr:serine/threonine-protein phosphatase [Anaerolineae bacterium]MBT7071010.1 serine/threonine-protein phosphatase [Anaerolineae bacterium]MBT7325812.1 serine/threonine-protein phosphatase [Anaerolineae bacterium]
MISAERAHLFVAALSHKGMKKGKNNEDRYAISSYHISKENPTPVLFAIVADGIGGHQAGEVAAEMVVDYASEAVAASDAQSPLETIAKAIDAANSAVVTKAEEDHGKQGMGSTCVCAWVIDDRLYAGTIGDSRLYLMRGAVIQQLSTDHTWIQEALDKGILTPDQAREHPNVHVIRRYIGSNPPPEVDFRLRLAPDQGDEAMLANQGMRLRPGDTVLLCSDGLTDLVWNDEILEIVRSKKNLKDAAQTLINLANERGGHDNITVVLISAPKDGKEKKKKPPLGWIIGGVVGFLIAVTALIGFIRYISQPATTPTPTLTEVRTAETLVFEETLVPLITMTPAPTLTLTPRPTQGPTYTPWPTNTSEPEV